MEYMTNYYTALWKEKKKCKVIELSVSSQMKNDRAGKHTFVLTFLIQILTGTRSFQNKQFMIAVFSYMTNCQDIFKFNLENFS